METCFICRKHQGQEAAPPGGYIYEDETWMVCHAPGRLGPLGTLFIESKRHFLDYAGMNEQEAAVFGKCDEKGLFRTQTPYRCRTHLPIHLHRGCTHFHSWLVPRGKDVGEKGLKFLARDDSCKEEDAARLAGELRETIQA